MASVLMSAFTCVMHHLRADLYRPQRIISKMFLTQEIYQGGKSVTISHPSCDDGC